MALNAPDDVAEQGVTLSRLVGWLDNPVAVKRRCLLVASALYLGINIADADAEFIGGLFSFSGELQPASRVLQFSQSGDEVVLTGRSLRPFLRLLRLPFGRPLDQLVELLAGATCLSPIDNVAF